MAALLAPVGYVVQDVVADAMTVEVVPEVDEQSNPFDSRQLKLMHTTMQTLGRIAIIGGGITVSFINILLFYDVEKMVEAEKVAVYISIYRLGVHVFRAESDFANGNTRDLRGRLITCEHGKRRVTRTEVDGSFTVLADQYDGKPLNSPNDVVVKSNGTVWFTDPDYQTGNIAAKID